MDTLQGRTYKITLHENCENAIIVMCLHIICHPVVYLGFCVELMRAKRKALFTGIAQKYRVIHKSLRNFRTRLLNNQERQGRKEHINRYTISQSFFFVLGALAYLQVPPLGGSRDEKWRAQ